MQPVVRRATNSARGWTATRHGRRARYAKNCPTRPLRRCGLSQPGNFSRPRTRGKVWPSRRQNAAPAARHRGRTDRRRGGGRVTARGHQPPAEAPRRDPSAIIRVHPRSSVAKPTHPSRPTPRGGRLGTRCSPGRCRSGPRSPCGTALRQPLITRGLEEKELVAVRNDAVLHHLSHGQQNVYTENNSKSSRLLAMQGGYV